MAIEKAPSAVLLIAFNSFAGMGPYVISIVNSFKPEDNVRFFLIERDDHYYSRNINEELRHKATIVSSPVPTKIQTLISILTGFRCKFRKQIEEICERENISMVHDLTGAADNALVASITAKRPWLYTVHDLHSHEAKKSFFKEWRQNRLYSRVYKAIASCENLITNSNSQYRELLSIFPQKKCFMSPFPSLITKTIMDGKLYTPELEDSKNYILFFGRIEEYKGLSVLIEAFKNIQQNTKLVIAGSGELPYAINDDRIILVNRYIDDQEVANLYVNSRCVVYPYLSATQSGVIAVATYFHTPVIASNVTFFKEVLGDDYIGLFNSGNSNDLFSKLELFISLSDESYFKLKKQMADLYQTNYEGQRQREMLISTYSQINRVN